MTRILALVLAGAAVCAMPGAAGAAGVDAQVTIGQLSYTLTDLDPNDGVNPSITFLPLSATSGSSAAVLLTYEIPGGWKNDFKYGVGREALTGSLSGPDESLSGSATGLDELRTWTVNAQAGASFAADQPDVIDARALSGEQAFVLSPHTELTVTATTRRTWSVDPGAYFTSVATDAYLVLAAQDPLGPIDTFASPHDGPFGPAPFDVSAGVSAVYANNNAVSVNGSVELFADVQVSHGVTTPVPEPANVAMYATALPLLLALRRRARRRTRA